METHHELSGYVRCGDTQRLVAAIVAICEREGLRRVEDTPVPVLAPIEPREGFVSIAVLPGAADWHVVLSRPEGFLGERASADARTRFLDLCDELQSPGFFQEVDGGDAVNGYGSAMLESDGRGNHAVSGYMWRHEYADADPAENKHLDWNGYRLDEDLMHSGFLLVRDALPGTYDEEMTRWYSDIPEALECGRSAHHLGGPETSRYWKPEAPWFIVRQALHLGGDLPVPGGAILTFAPASAQPEAVPATVTPTTTTPPTTPPADVDLPGFLYGDGSAIRRGDEARLGSGDKVAVTGLLTRSGAAGEEPGGVCVDGTAGNYVVDPTAFHTLQLIRRAPAPAPTPSGDDLERLALAGDAAAQYAVGVIHNKGNGGSRWLRAATWFRRAAEQGHAAAQYELGYAHYLGDGAPEDWSESFRWMSLAAAQNQPDALRFLVNRIGGRLWRLTLYRQHMGLTEDMSAVAALLEQLARLGDESAQYELAQLYDTGNGVAPDTAKAMHWYRLAAEQGHAVSAKRLADLGS